MILFPSKYPDDLLATNCIKHLRSTLDRRLNHE